MRECDGCNGSFGGERVVFRGDGQGIRDCFGLDEAGLIVIDSQTAMSLASYEAILAHFASADFDPGTLRIATRYTLPPAFIRDCLACDCDIGSYDNGVLAASPTQIEELRNRALHYIDHHGPDAAPAGLKTAAYALLRALRRERRSQCALTAHNRASEAI